MRYSNTLRHEIIFPLAVNLLMTTNKPKCRPLNSAYMACNAFCFGRNVKMIIFGTLAVYGFMMTQFPPKLLDFNQTLQG